MYSHRFGPAVEPFLSALPPQTRSFATGEASVSQEAAPVVLSNDGSNTGESMLNNLIDMVKTSLEKIHMAMNYSEISKLNTYVDNIQTQEKARINETHESMANNLMLTQQMYLMQTRETDRLSSRIRVLLLSMLAVSVVFALMPFSGTALGVAAIVVAVIVYCACLLLYFRSVKLRRYDDWSKRYWRSDINPADSVTTSVDVDGEKGDCGLTGDNALLQ